jgi:type IV pilus assembly protein PilE
MHRGFSLLEMLMVVAISAIILTIAVPSYQHYMRRGRRVDGIHSILALRLAEEQYRTQNTQYGTLAQVQSLTGISLSTHYAFTITNISATTYVITASAVGSQANDMENGTSCDSLAFAMNNTIESKTPEVCWIS